MPERQLAALLILICFAAYGQAPLDNATIGKLVKDGVAESTIVAMIDQQPGRYALSSDDMIALKRAGVSDKILAAMIVRNEAAKRASPNPWRASATIIEAEPKTRLGRGGKLGVSLSYLPLLNGNKVAIRATREGAPTDGAPAPAEALARPAAPSLLFVFGRDETFPEGTAILLRITRAPWSHVWHTRRRDAFHHQAGTRHVQSRVLSREVYTI